jgi:hypothetical protein
LLIKRWLSRWPGADTPGHRSRGITPFRRRRTAAPSRRLIGDWITGADVRPQCARRPASCGGSPNMYGFIVVMLPMGDEWGWSRSRAEDGVTFHRGRIPAGRHLRGVACRRPRRQSGVSARGLAHQTRIRPVGVVIREDLEDLIDPKFCPTASHCSTAPTHWCWERMRNWLDRFLRP